MTCFTWYIDIRQEIHADDFDTISLTGFTSSPFCIEGESALIVTSHTCFRRFCIDITDIIKYSSICCRIGAWCTSDRLLVYLNKFVDVFKS